MNRKKNRCAWVNLKNPNYVRYHDREWGTPEHDDTKLFEFLILESFQAGLSWECVLNKRDAFRAAFDNFDIHKISNYDEKKIAELMSNPEIIRNRRKIKAAIINSQIFMDIQKEYGSFNAYLWSFTNNRTMVEDYSFRSTSPLSDTISDDLSRRGMKFVGSTIVYSYLQAVGVINGHGCECDWHG